MHRFLHRNFRLKHFFSILFSSDFALIPNCSSYPNSHPSSYLLDVIYNDANRLSLSSSIFEKFGCKHWDLFKKGPIFGMRQRKYAKTLGGGRRAQGHKSFQFHSFCIIFVFITIFSLRFHF